MHWVFLLQTRQITSTAENDKRSLQAKRRAAVSGLLARQRNGATAGPSSKMDESNAATRERASDEAPRGPACAPDAAEANKEPEDQTTDMCIDEDEPREPEPESKPEASESESLSVAGESDAQVEERTRDERRESPDRQERSASASTSTAVARELRSPDGSLKSPPIRFTLKQQSPRLQASNRRLFSADVGQRVELMSPDRQDSPLTSPVTGHTSMSDSRDPSPHSNRRALARPSRRRQSPNTNYSYLRRDMKRNDSGLRRSREGAFYRRESDSRQSRAARERGYSPTRTRRSDRNDDRWTVRRRDSRDAHLQTNRFARERDRESQRMAQPAEYESGSWRATAIRIQRPPSFTRNVRLFCTSIYSKFETHLQTGVLIKFEVLNRLLAKLGVCTSTQYPINMDQLYGYYSVYILLHCMTMHCSVFHIQ